jgi:anti-sigma B factor antagonist
VALSLRDGTVTDVDHFEIIQNGGTRAGVAELAIAGEVDLATSPELKRALFDSLDAGIRDLRVDMAAVELIDATGIGVLVSASNRARRKGGHVTVRKPSAAVRRVLTLVDLEGVIRVEE